MGIWHMGSYRTIYHTQFLFRFQQKNNIDKFLSLFASYFDSIEEVTIASAVLGWSLEWGNCRWWASQAYGHYKSSHYCHGTARLELQREQHIHKAATANQSRAAKTACKVIFSGLKWFLPSRLQASLESRMSFSLTFSPALSWPCSTIFCCPGLTDHLGAQHIQGTPQLCTSPFVNQS